MTEEPEPFDVEAFFERMDRNKREQELIVARRPTANELSESISTITRLLYETLDTVRQIAALERGFDPGETYQWFPREGSQALVDFEAFEPIVVEYCATADPASTHWLAANPRRNPAAWSIDYLGRCYRTVVDDFVAIGNLVGTQDHIRAPITLARSVVEAAAMGCFLLDNAVDAQERLRRTLNLHFTELKESANAGIGAADDEAEIAELTAFAEKFGFAVRYRPERHYPPVIVAQEQRQPDSIRLILDQVLPDGLGRTMWRSLSAVAHSRAAHSILPDEYGLAHEVKPWQRTQAAAWHTMPAFYVVQELCRRMGTSLGWNLDATVDALDVVGVQWGIGAGLYDNQIRDSLGLNEDD